MPLQSELILPRDGRQSETAVLVARGTRRLLRARKFATLTEMALASGRRADIVALAQDSTILIIEIKSSIADFRADSKWPDYRAHCDRLYFAISAEVPPEIMPEEAGLIIADGFGAEMVREAPDHRLPGATRRSMLVRFAHAAAHRLHGLADPEILSFGSV